MLKNIFSSKYLFFFAQALSFLTAFAFPYFFAIEYCDELFLGTSLANFLLPVLFFKMDIVFNKDEAKFPIVSTAGWVSVILCVLGFLAVSQWRESYFLLVIASLALNSLAASLLLRVKFNYYVNGFLLSTLGTLVLIYVLSDWRWGLLIAFVLPKVIFYITSWFVYLKHREEPFRDVPLFITSFSFSKVFKYIKETWPIVANDFIAQGLNNSPLLLLNALGMGSYTSTVYYAQRLGQAPSIILPPFYSGQFRAQKEGELHDIPNRSKVIFGAFGVGILGMILFYFLDLEYVSVSREVLLIAFAFLPLGYVQTEIQSKNFVFVKTDQVKRLNFWGVTSLIFVSLGTFVWSVFGEQEVLIFAGWYSTVFLGSYLMILNPNRYPWK
ncbi:MAG: hypothetical protein SchgKO_23850 [Schleiferiaceae bacterium]